MPQAHSGPGLGHARTKHPTSAEAKKHPPWRRTVAPTPLNELKGPSQLVASALPDGFPPELAYRALAAYALLRTLSRQLRLSPFTPNVFLRALALPYPNRLLGQIHVCLLRILFPNLDLGYSYRQHGGLVTSKRVRIEEHDGVRQMTIPLIAGDNLTYLDGLSWPLFYDDYVHLTADAIWTALNRTELNVDYRSIALRLPSSLETFEESEEEDIEQAEELEKPTPSRVEHIGGVGAADAATVPGRTSSARKRAGWGRGLPTRQNRILKSKQKAANLGSSSIVPSGSESDSDSESDYDDKDDEYRTSSGRRSKRKRKAQKKSKSRRNKGPLGNAASPSVTKKTALVPLSSPGSRVIEVSMAHGPGATIPLPLPMMAQSLQPEHDRPLNAWNSSSAPRNDWPTLMQNTPISNFPTPPLHESTGVKSIPGNHVGSASSLHPSLAPSHLNGQSGCSIPQRIGSLPSSSLTTFSTSVTAPSYSNTDDSVDSCSTSHEQQSKKVQKMFHQPIHLQHLHHFQHQKLLMQAHPMLGTQPYHITWTGRPSAVTDTHKRGLLGAPHTSPFRSRATKYVPKTKPHEASYEVADKIQNFISKKFTSPPALHQTKSSQVLKEVPENVNGDEPGAPTKKKARMDGAATLAGLQPSEPNPLEPTSSTVGTSATKNDSSSSHYAALDSDVSVAAPQFSSAAGSSEGKPDGEEPTTTTETRYDQSNPETWPQFKPIKRMRRGVPYHRLPVEQKLNVLEFMIDELLTVDSIAAEFSRRHCVTSCYGVPYGALPTDSELEAMDNDDACVVCGQEGELLCCDGCTASYHRRCSNVAIGSAVPEGTWLCADCKVADPSQFGTLRGGKKCALDWFTLDDLEEGHRQIIALSGASSPPLATDSAGESVVNASVHEEVSNDTRLAPHVERYAVPLTTPADAATIPEIPMSTGMDGATRSEKRPDASQRMDDKSHGIDSENRNTRCIEANHVDGLTHVPTAPLPHAPTDNDLDQTEFLVIHGFVFVRRRLSDEAGHIGGGGDSSSLWLGTKPIIPLTQSELSKLLAKLGPRMSLNWPLVQIPSRAWDSSPFLLRKGISYDMYFSSVESYDPSMYMSRYRMAPFPRSKKHRCIGSQLNHLVHSEYETECASSSTHKISSLLSRDMSSDSCLAKELQARTDLYNPYHLFTNYMLKLEGNLRSACLLDISWGMINDDCRKDVWAMNVRRCRSVRRLALLLVRLVDAANSRVFFPDWHRPPNHSSGKVDAESDSRIYLPLPADWTPEAELRKRKLERSSYSHFGRLFVAESPHFDGLGKGINIDAKSSTSSGSRKRKQSKLPVRSAIAMPTCHNSKKQTEHLAEQPSPSALTMKHGSSNAVIDCSPELNPAVNVPKQARTIETINRGSPSKTSTGNVSTGRSGNFTFSREACDSDYTLTLVASAFESGRNVTFANRESVGASGNTVKRQGVRDSIVSEPVASSQHNAPSSDILRPPVMSSVQHGNTNASSQDASVQQKRSDSENHNLAMEPSVLIDGTSNTTVAVTNGESGGVTSAQRKGGGNNLDGDPGKEPRRSRRSGRLKKQGDVHDNIESYVKRSSSRSSDTRNPMGVLDNTGMEELIAVERTAKVRMIEELMRSPFEKEIHWPLAGRTLFEPLGSLSPSEMKRLGRNAGTVVAPYLTYNSLFEVGQAAVCHIWRKKTLQCNSFEELVMQIRVLDSFINKSVSFGSCAFRNCPYHVDFSLCVELLFSLRSQAIGACESLARRAASSKSQVQKVIRCSQRDLATGIMCYFVVNKGKFRGCWISEDTIDLSALILERSNCRDTQLKMFNERLRLKTKKESMHPPPSLANATANSTRVHTSVPSATASKHRQVANKRTSSSGSHGSMLPRAIQSAYSGAGCKAAIEAIALQHRIETGGLLLKCAKLGLSSVPYAMMNDVRAKHMLQLKNAVAALEENGMPFANQDQLVDHLMKAEASASLQHQSSAANAQSQGTLEDLSGFRNLLSNDVSNKGHSLGPSVGRHATFPFDVGLHLQGCNATSSRGDFVKPPEMHLNSQQIAPIQETRHPQDIADAQLASTASIHSMSPPNQIAFTGQNPQQITPMEKTRHRNFIADAQLASTASMHSMPPPNQIAFTGQHFQFGQPVYFQSNHASGLYGTSTASLYPQLPGKFWVWYSLCSVWNLCCSFTMVVTNYRYLTVTLVFLFTYLGNASFAPGFAGTNAMGQTPGQLNQFTNDWARNICNLNGTATSSGDGLNWYRQCNDIGGGISVPQNQLRVDAATSSVNSNFVSAQQRRIVNSSEMPLVGSTPSSTVTRSSDYPYVSAMDFEPRPLEEMAKDKGYRS